ncbi:MAG: methionyl-tRNA formyltransferase [Hyphomicrobiaceae bacterium]|nr:methionyl-tRNA formyltransferase [Hyphomicrobiaceae bacterium]
MRIVFMGTPDFAVPALVALLAAGHRIAAVYTRAPQRAGRGMEERKSPVHLHAEGAGLPVLTPRSLRDGAAQQAFVAHAADVGVVVAYGLILPRPVLEAPRHGCLNLHGSALPRWRGAAPIARAVMAGDTATAASIMRMDEGLDTGPVCLAEPVPIGADTTAGELHDMLAERGAALMVEALARIERGTLACVPQPAVGITYAAKIDKAETGIDFTRRAREVHNHVRGLSPVPGAWFTVGGKGERIKVLRTHVAPGSGAPGTVLDAALTIACGEGSVQLLELQRAGKRPMAAAEFLRGFALPQGTRIR